MSESVIILKVGEVFRVVAAFYDFCDFTSLEEATKFCNDMGYKILPLNSKLGVRILNPTDPRSI